MSVARRLLLVAVPAIFGLALLAPSLAPQLWPDAAAPVGAAELLADLTQLDASAKIESELKVLDASDPTAPRVPIVVQSTLPVALDGFAGYVHAFRWPAGEYVAVLEARPADLKAIADLPGVYAVDSGVVDRTRQRPPEPGFEPVVSTTDPETLRALAQAAPAWRQAPADTAVNTLAQDATIDAARPAGWYDARDGHAAAEAWEMGYRGEGVTVGVLDNAVDFAHPDLQGTWRVLPDGHPYAGWPQAFDPPAGLAATQDAGRAPELRSTRTGASGLIEAYQTAEVTTGGTVTDPLTVACLQPLNFFTGQGNILQETCVEHVVPETSQGGTVRFGHHPDGLLRSMSVDGTPEYAGVLLVDEGESGVYDTVYLDMDGDRDFTDEKPLNQADPVAWRDVNGDDIADLSGGLLYWIADGQTSFPGAWVWGLDDQLPEQGHMVAFLYAGGGHGTLCASNVVGQGRLGVPEGRDLRFRDLPGDGQPGSTNLGMSPEAGMVSIGDVYVGGRVLFASAWRYAVLGHDVDRDDDQIQVTSNSYGWSDVDIDGWEDDARLIDHYVRTHSPTTSMVFSTGNGGPGYGTIAPPSPSVGMGIAASTQMGSTGLDSITDTTQITYGDYIPFSNRGPGADGRVGPTVGANGAYASGANPLNLIGGTDGRLANATWGGTSRSGPVANGVLALAYQAFMEKHERWPTYMEARSILMAGARYNGYDVFTMGGGVIDAADSASIGAGRHGVYAMPPEWTAGGYRGERFEAFAKILTPGQSDMVEVTLHNPSDEDVEVSLSAMTSRRIGSHDTSFETNQPDLSPSGPSPDYLLPIDESIVPDGTEMMIARGTHAFDQYDPDGNYTADNFFVAGVVQHTDINGNGLLWTDADGNGAVNSKAMAPNYVAVSYEGNEDEYDATEGAITRQLVPGEPLSGELAWYGLACGTGEAHPPPAQDVSERIALIERGTCNFSEKVLNAQQEGAIGVVVFTDARPVVAMGGDGTGIEIPGVMIGRPDGLAIRTVLEEGTAVDASMVRRDGELKGLDGSAPLVYEESEIERFEYMRLNYENGVRNHFAVPVHHPRERWADGLYLGLWHTGRSPAITNTQLTLRYDFYAYEPWDVVTLGSDTVTVPAGGSATVDVTMSIPDDMPAGGYQGAIFADYDRAEGDTVAPSAGGWEHPQQRIVIPVNANVAAEYDWKGAITMGGEAADDSDAHYNNGAVQGTFKWNWRAESGDWRFFFVDASQPEPDTHWIMRTTWEDEDEGHSDIDMRFLGPSVDRWSSADHADNKDEDWSDPDWFGPHTMALLARSPYLAAGSVWPFDTSSGKHEDWLAAPADDEGLHEMMLHNVLFSGSQLEMPFETTLSSARLSVNGVGLLGDNCVEVSLNSEMDLPGFTASGLGLSDPPQVLTDQPVVQDDPNDRTSSSYRYTITLGVETPFFTVKLAGEDDDDLDLVLLYDANQDGVFDYATELVGESAGATSAEQIEVPGVAAAGMYQVWVHGWAVTGDDSKFDLTVDIVSGDTLSVDGAPAEVTAGSPATFEVCADLDELDADAEGPLYGVIQAGPSGAPDLFSLPVSWVRTGPTIYLPMVARDATIRAEDMP